MQVKMFVSVEVSDEKMAAMNAKRLRAGTQMKSFHDEVENVIAGSLQHHHAISNVTVTPCSPRLRVRVLHSDKGVRQ